MEKIGGYRLVRSLGSGPRAEVWLGHADRGLAAIKLFRPHVPEESIGAEIESLGRASSRHLLRLDDLTTAPDGRPCLILQRLSARSLGSILDQDVLDAGEAVTILAPLALAVAELHRVGVAHGDIRAASVLFDESGTPVLSCFGAARTIGAFPDPPEATSLTAPVLAAEPLVAQDVNQLSALGRLVLSRVAGAEGEADRIVGIAAVADAAQWPARFAEELFRFAPATAVRPDRLSESGSVEGGPFEGGMVEQTDDAVVRVSPRTAALESSWATARAGGAPADRVVARPDGRAGERAGDDRTSDGNGGGGKVDGNHSGPKSRTDGSRTDGGGVERLGFLASSAHGLVGRVREFLRPVRRSVWILAAVVAACLAAGFVLLPSEGGAVPASSPEKDATTDPSGSPQDRENPSVLGGDPVLAASALLEQRAECFRLRSVLCLDGVDQLGSAAMDADGYSIRLVQQGGLPPEEPDYDGAVVTIVEELGDAVLLEVSAGQVDSAEPPGPPGSLLLVREDEGWRIRDLVPLGGEGRSVDPED